ncbi:conserved hypothetical membrane protein [Thermoplasma acidophilum]|uniref:Conserved hypothetical membrane protein n=1 Tax=Thermoplasma acidophilum (strain ATCC 25905 / DSM 1728 / JCM 9062 / NBRC 15155 / AMRC-C165) TaxID=273075 RepID=Q9HK70_THEAC|nr:ABC transporter permease [Thermoplasma acidophilum]CAC11869.1 conserved hypothetical membrane protein [Thermoplasma acidophilum]
MNGLYSVIRYELNLDLRKKKAMAVFGMVVFFAVCFSLLIPKYANGTFFTYRPEAWDWMYTVAEEFDTIVAGLFGLITGGLLSVDSIAGEFENGTISRLYSLPINRWEIYFGKVIEKIAMFTILSLITIVLSISINTAVSGIQSDFSWLPYFILGYVLSLTSYAAISFMFGSAIKNSSLTFTALFAAWIFSDIAYFFIVFRHGFSLIIDAMPYINFSEVLPAGFLMFLDHGGSISLTMQVLGSFKTYEVPASLYVASILASSIAELSLFLMLGYIVFRRGDL